MIGTTISYISKRVDSHLRMVNQKDKDGSSPPLAALIDGAQLDPLVLPLGTISLLVVDVNEDREFRDADRFQRRISTAESNKIENHYPDLHLDIGLIFVAKFKDYDRAWNQLAHVIGFFPATSLLRCSTRSGSTLWDWPLSGRILSAVAQANHRPLERAKDLPTSSRDVSLPLAHHQRAAAQRATSSDQECADQVHTPIPQP